FYRLISFQFDLDQLALSSSCIVSPARSLMSASSSITTTATAATTAATAAFFPRSGHIHREISSLKFLSVKHLNGFVCFFVRAHFDEAKSSSFTRHSILHHINGNHSSRLRKEFLKLVF